MERSSFGVCDTHLFRNEGDLRLRLKSTLRKLAQTVCAACLVGAMISCQSRSGGSDVMAIVDGRKIFRADVEKYYPAQAAASGQQPTGEQTTSLRLSILRELIDEEILMRRAEKLGLLATDEEVERKLGELKSPYTQEEFNRQLQEKKITFED